MKGIATTAPREHVALLRADVRYAIRNLRRNPGFTAVAAMVLAVGIGANAAVFTIVDGVLIVALPYKDPQQLVVMFEKVRLRLSRSSSSPRPISRSCAKRHSRTPA